MSAATALENKTRLSVPLTTRNEKAR